MKKTLLSFFLASIAYLGNLNAQCTVSNVNIATTSVDATSCVVTLNLSYTADVNGGSKYVVVHLWQGSHASPGAYPVATSKTASMIGTIVVKNPGVTPSLLSAWPSDMKTGTTPSTPILTGGFLWSTNANGTRTYNFTGLHVNVTNCSTQAATITGDIWATQNTNNASCLTANAISVIANDPVMIGFSRCNNPSPSQFSISFKTIAPQTITFSAYKDANNNGIFDDADKTNGKLTLTGGGIAGSTTDVIVTPTQGELTQYGLYTYDQQPVGSKFDVFVVARVAGHDYDNVLLIGNSCASPLPVNFKSFTAGKSGSTNALRWTTSTEINNKGFYVQRFYNGQWENLGFVATKADGGNSTSDLNYVFNDVFNFKGVVQYRILQVDIDGKAKYSQVRSLSNEGNGVASSILIYPNPASAHGNVSLVLNDASAFYDLQIIDNAGRIVKEFNAVRSTQQVSGLPKGQYLARAEERESGQVSVEKFIVQ